MTKVSDRMARDVKVVRGDDTIWQATRIMAQIDAGALPVTDGLSLIGIITDRDIAIRGVARDANLGAMVREVMTPDPHHCFEDESLEAVALSMGEKQVRRMPVMNRDHQLVGILSLADVALGGGAIPAGGTLSDIVRPGGQRSQIDPSGQFPWPPQLIH